MLKYISKDRGLLFCTKDLREMLTNLVQAMRNEVEKLDPNRLLNTAPADLAQYLTHKYQVTSVALRKDQWYLTESEAQVDVRYDPMRWIDDKTRPVLLPGQRIEVRIPFDGDRELLYLRGNQITFNPPRAIVENQEIILTYEMPADMPRDIRPEIDSTLQQIEQQLLWQQGMIGAHNASLSQIADDAISVRRQRLLANSGRVSSLGIPVKPRADAPKTYTIPTTFRKATPVLPPATSTPFEPEPAWAIDHYEHALNVIQQMALVIERSPTAFRRMNEEDLRQHFLVQLNGHFQGKATGETFNLEGKTDILLREGSRNVFIAECKFWKGPRKFSEAIDQLLGYAAWRDSKTAILIFNRGTELSVVLSAVCKTAKAHSNFKRSIEWPHETGFRYVFHHNGDPNREFVLSVLVFNVPE